MEATTREPDERDDANEPILLMSLGEATTQTQGQGAGSSEDKRRAYN